MILTDPRSTFLYIKNNLKSIWQVGFEVIKTDHDVMYEYTKMANVQLQINLL